MISGRFRSSSRSLLLSLSRVSQFVPVLGGSSRKILNLISRPAYEKMKNPPIIHSYVQVNKSFVHLAQYGSTESILKRNPNEQDCKLQCDKPKKLIIFVPGNPGILGVYHDFLIALLERFSDHQDQPHILAIGHNNFDHPDCVDHHIDETISLSDEDLNFVEKSRCADLVCQPHHIELQVQNKLIILKKLLKNGLQNYRIVFVGHSVGCYVILRLLQDKQVSNSHRLSVLIHPALENLAKTEGGTKVATWFRYKLDYPARAVALILDNLIPKSVKLAITKWNFSPEYLQYSSQVAVESMSQMVCRRTLTALVEMAKSELALIGDLQVESMIKPHISKLRLIYAVNDHWVNIDNRHMLKDLFPDMHIEEQPNLHAFVMEPKTVAEYAAKVNVFVRDPFP